jgi:hypothetical protein
MQVTLPPQFQRKRLSGRGTAFNAGFPIWQDLPVRNFARNNVNHTCGTKIGNLGGSKRNFLRSFNEKSGHHCQSIGYKIIQSRYHPGRSYKGHSIISRKVDGATADKWRSEGFF